MLYRKYARCMRAMPDGNLSAHSKREKGAREGGPRFAIGEMIEHLLMVMKRDDGTD
jgi:hypothetical protein